MTTIRAATFSIDVPDMGAAVDFYADGLGLDPVGPSSADSFRLDAGGVRIDVLERPAGSPAWKGDGTRSYQRHWTPVHLDLVVEDLEAAVHDAERAGGTVEVPPRTVDGERLATCADPFGHGFCLVEDTTP